MMLDVAVRHRFPGFALDCAFTAPSPGVVALFGASGAGKSSIVAAVAGLLRTESARIVIDGRCLADTAAGEFLPPERRRIGLVFQDARLFPHLRVRDNLRYGLRRAPRADAVVIEEAEVIALLDLDALLHRFPRHLSGGERQRVAIGRALLAQPRLLLMDEPLASLDAPRKAEILPYLLRLKQRLALPLLYVSHALDEVAYLADTLVLLEAGRSVAAGPFEEIASRAALPLAARDDAGAILAMRVAEHDTARRLTRLERAGLTLWVPLRVAPLASALRVRVPAREVILARSAPDGISVHNLLPATVRAIVAEPARHAALVELECGAGEAVLLARVTPDAVSRLALHPGAPVLALVKSMAIEIL